MEQNVIIGASRGLGRALFDLLDRNGEGGILVARDRRLLERQCGSSGRWSSLPLDMSTDIGAEALCDVLGNFKRARIFYLCGGGPHGHFADKNWRDHEWAYNVNFRTPARLLHHSLKVVPKSVQEFLYVGSAIVEGGHEEKASSYSLSKRAMKNLISTVNQESPPFPVKIFSPGYMDTDLLPQKTRPRKENLVISPEEAASDLLGWVESSTDEWHRVFLPYEFEQK